MDMRVLPVWAATRGEGVQVSVSDDAVELFHADLFQNVVPGANSDFIYPLNNQLGLYPMPCVAGDSHGTSVAGVIAARDDNGIGVAGVAPRAKLIANNMLSSSSSSAGAEAMTLHLDTTGVYHNSWGSPDDGFLHDSETLWQNAIETGLRDGRGQKGAIYVFAAGNGNQLDIPTTSGPSNVGTENSNFDGYVNKRGVIAVCAIDDDGKQAYYSEPGANLLLCAPSGGALGTAAITTTALGSDYRSNFSGTSGAAPMISGVVALMLSANPQLSWRDVRWILAQTARETDAADPSWAASAISAPGGGAKRFSHKFGFGLVDADAAVALSRTWTTVGNSATLKTCGPYTRTPATTIADAPGAALVDANSVAGCSISQIEFVEISVDSDHTYSGDLRIQLISPSGRISELADARFCGANVAPPDPCRSSYSNWTFGSSRHLGEPANGGWQLSVTDTRSGETGHLNSWSLRLHGR